MKLPATRHPGTPIIGVLVAALVAVATALVALTTSAPAVAAPLTTVWLAGDSTMANSSGTDIVGWGREFGANFTSDVTVVNKAAGGRSIQTWMYESNVSSTKNSSGECALTSTAYSDRWQSTLDGMRSGDYLFIQFGINDGDSACPRHVGSTRFRELLTTMAKAATARGAHPVFLTPVAAITCQGSTAVGNRGFVSETLTAGASTGTPVINLHTLSVALYNSLKLCPNNGDYTQGAVGAFFANDHTHFSASGAQQIAAVVAQALARQSIPLAAYLRSANPTPTATATTTPIPTPTPTPTTTPTPTPTTTPTPTPTPTPSGDSACTVTYRVASQWNGGFTGDVTLTNTGGTALSGWTVGWTFTGDQRITNAWNAVATQTGSTVVAKDAGYNAALAPQSSVSFGFQATATSITAPTSFTVNGMPCTS